MTFNFHALKTWFFSFHLRLTIEDHLPHSSANWGLHSGTYCAYLGNIRSSMHSMQRWNPRSREPVSLAVMPADRETIHHYGGIMGLWMNSKNSSAFECRSTKCKVYILCRIFLKTVQKSVYNPCFVVYTSAHLSSLIWNECTVYTVYTENTIYTVCTVYIVCIVCTSMHK